MRPILIAAALAAALPACAQAPYRILKTVTVGGEGGFDYISADSIGRRLYIARSGKADPRITVYDLDTLAPAGTVASASAHGVAIDAATHHGIASSKPVTLFDTVTQAVIKTLPIGGEADGLAADGGRIYVYGGGSPNITAYNAGDGSIAGTVDLKADPEQAAADGRGHLYIDLNDKNQVGVIDTQSLAVTARHDLGSTCGLPTGLAVDAKKRILFVGCRNPAQLVILNADSGAILSSFAIGLQNDGVAFNPATGEAFVPTGDGQLVVVKEAGADFSVEQTLATPPGARTIALDSKTGHLFLMTADFAPPPPGATVKTGRIARGPAIAGSFKIIEVGR